jgi:two-component system cell cycle response regulator DivK
VNILYLEDSDLDVRLVQQYMKTVDHEFTPVGTIAEARTYLQYQHPDVFLVDIVIGQETAYDLVTQVKTQKLSKHIVAVTAKALPVDQQRCFDVGCDHVLAKPFTIDDLEHVLNQLSQEH